MTSQDDSMTRQDEVQEEASKSGVNRRQFLTAGSAALAALAFSGRANADTTSPQIPVQLISAPKPKLSASDQPHFEQPPLWKQSDGKLADLVAKDVRVRYPGGNTEISEITLRSYNGGIPGPTLCVGSNDRIDFKLCNNLPQEDKHDHFTDNDDHKEAYDFCEDPAQHNQPNCFSATNLHFHGLHVSPNAPSDFVLHNVYPGQTYDHSVQLSNHAPGTHWYHPHRHGSTGIQASNGMAAALIIKEPSQDLNIVADNEDKIWLIQELNSLGDASREDGGLAIYQGAGGQGSATKSTFLVNSDFQPVLLMETGTMQRWRFINATATPGGFMRLVLYKYSDDPNAPLDGSTSVTDVTKLSPMSLIAMDGISFYGKPPKVYPNPDTNEYFQFSPGNRADFLVLPTTTGMYKLIKQAYSTWDGKIISATKNRDQVLAYIQVTEGNRHDSIPSTIPGDSSNYSYLSLADNPNQPTHTLTFAAAPGQFTINGNRYDGDNTKITVNLNSTEDWIIETVLGGAGAPTPHPFHIHVNPFQVVATGQIQSDQSIKWTDVPESQRFWQDTVSVEVGRPLKIRQTFKDYPGEFVLHCHILLHEDQGMMYKVAINDPSSAAGEQVST